MSAEKKPRCERMLRKADGERYRCHFDGVYCYVVGEFGRLPKVLCGLCIAELEKIGWKVVYQLEGDAASVKS